MKKLVVMIYTLLVVVIVLNAQQTDFPKLTGPYLGQKPPGMTPVIFAPGLISTEFHYECCRAISSDGKEFFFVRDLEGGNKIYRMIERKNRWTKPEMIPYSDKAFQYTPFISPGGETFVFMAGKAKPVRGGNDTLPEILICKRKGNDWETSASKFTLIGGAQPFYITITKNGVYYFSCIDRDGIYKSEFKDGKFAPAEKLPDEINYLERVNHPYISPDESYLIVDSRHHGSMDLFISFHKKDGTWTKAVSMGGAINSADNEMCPSVSNDGKYFFFGRSSNDRKTDIYWVSTKIIEKLRPKE